ncbi:MFS transporter [Paenibacillus sp. NEAU-GSW1]|uniref:MFS transporter n=1 Tax=Paenibacillus sp. NEAU-GSW1 TaxID=2682486 RepID=UPI001C12B5E7|nr:MFS transporter [Paenibacillus sp. NEAU-GSW1]
MVMVMAALLFAAVNQTMIGTLSPRISMEWDRIRDMNDLFNVFQLFCAVATALSGSLSDRIGRKPLLIVGISVLMLGTLLCGLSASMDQLILFRALQGCGVGILIATSFAVVGDLFAPRERGTWLGILTSVYGAASLIGPVLGGLIADRASWRWAFFVSLPIGLIALAFITGRYPSSPRTNRSPFDYKGALSLTIFLSALLLAISHSGSGSQFPASLIIGLYALSAGCAIWFWAICRSNPNAIVPTGLFRNREYALSCLVGFTTSVSMFGVMLYLPFYVQQVLGSSASQSGLVMVALSISLSLSNASSGWLLARKGTLRPVAFSGLIVMLVGNVLLTFMDMQTDILQASSYSVVYGFGLGIVLSVYALMAQNTVARSIVGSATATYQLTRQLGAAIGIAVMGYAFESRLANRSSALTDTPNALHNSIEIVCQIGIAATLIALILSLFIRQPAIKKEEHTIVDPVVRYRKSES